MAFFFAMEGEAQGLIDALGLEAMGQMEPGMPSQWFQGTVSGDSNEPLHVSVGLAGQDAEAKCDRIGTDSAVLSAFLLCKESKPDLLINAGTCGGFIQQGGRIGSVYVGAGAYLFHGRNIPLPGFREFGCGRIPALPSAAVAEAISAELGVISTSDSFTPTAEELAFFATEHVVAKDMEAAAIARMARDLGIPFLAVKVVTDLVDHHEKEQVLFLKNYQEVTSLLSNRLQVLVAWLLAGQDVGSLAK